MPSDLIWRRSLCAEDSFRDVRSLMVDDDDDDITLE